MRDERGSALIPVVLAMSLVTILTMTVFNDAVIAVRRSGVRRDNEQALYLAQSGAARALGLIAADHAYDTGHAVPAIADRSWALDEASSLATEQAREGEFSWIVPVGGDAVFGVGWAPSRSHPTAARVVRIDFSLANGVSPRALLTQTSLTVSGNPTLEGTGASAHANADVTISGSPSIDGDATAVGQYLETGHPTIGGAKGGGFPAVPIAAVDASTYRSLTDYDLCPDATVRLTFASVCGGAVAGTGLVKGWNGWKYTGGQWKLTTNTTIDASFFVYLSNLDITGNPGSPSSPWRTTIVVQGLRAGAFMTNGDCAISGNPVMRAAQQGIQMICDRDMSWRGNATAEGLMLAGENVDLSGNGTIIGSVVAAGTADASGSPVSANRASGSFLLRAEFGAPSVQGGVKTERWAEL